MAAGNRKWTAPNNRFGDSNAGTMSTRNTPFCNEDIENGFRKLSLRLLVLKTAAIDAMVADWRLEQSRWTGFVKTIQRDFSRFGKSVSVFRCGLYNLGAARHALYTQ
jgi:hypothetical protein